MPWERFNEVNDKYKGLNWAEGYEKEEVGSAVNLYRWLDTDPEGAYQYLTGLMQRGGYLKPSGTGNGNGNGHQHTQPHTGADGRPQPDIVIQETGQRFYSADQAERLLDWKLQQLDARFKPLEGNLMQSQSRAEANAQIAQAERELPHFSEHAEEIYKELQKDRRLSLEGAWRRVVYPKMRQIERAAVIDEMKTKGQAGSGTVNPGAPASMTTEEERKLPITELFRREMVKRGIGR